MLPGAMLSQSVLELENKRSRCVSWLESHDDRNTSRSEHSSATQQKKHCNVRNAVSRNDDSPADKRPLLVHNYLNDLSYNLVEAKAKAVPLHATEALGAE
jgi:hypothetical protein